jgi:RecJ-like exonuclease
MNNHYDLHCRHCGARIDEKYVDCYVCGGTGKIILDYTAEYAQETTDEDRALPCAKCDGRGRLPFDLVRSETGKATLWRLFELLS